MVQPPPLAFRPGATDAEIAKRTTDTRGHGRSAVVARDLARYYADLAVVLGTIHLTVDVARLLTEHIDCSGSGPLCHAIVDAVERYHILRAREPDVHPDQHLIAVGLWRGD